MMKEDLYEEAFEDAILFVLRKRRLKPDFTIDDLEKLLQAEYVQQGNDWVGRGELATLNQNARIAAYETLLAEWREETIKA